MNRDFCRPLLTTLVLLSSIIACAQVSKTETGEINGARYKILFPATWNKKLVVYAHGYEFMGSPSGIDNAQFGARLAPILNEGFAIAASAYRDQGFVLPDAIEDSEALRKKFIALYGKPDSTFVVGHSMGGGISIGIVEKYGANYQGALPLCPLSSKPYVQTRKEFDMITVFNALFPGILPPMSEIMNPAIPATPASELFGKAGPMGEALRKDSIGARMLAGRFDLKPGDLPFAVLFGQNVLKDVAVKSGGNPFDNRNTVYSGFADDWVVNGKVERLACDGSAYDYMNRYSPTGKVGIPVLFMHTTYDQLIPAHLAVTNYDNMVRANGNSKWLVVKYTNGQGHCQFTPEQLAYAFNALRAWAATGTAPMSGPVK